MYRQVPIGVVIPRHVEDVLATVDACQRRGVPILGRGCGTSLAGQCCNVAVVIDFSKYLNRILDIDTERRVAWVEPGVICDQLRNRTEQDHLTFAPDPATHEYCTLGGMIGNNSCGAHSMMGGRTSDNVEALQILTSDGQVMWVGETSDAELEQIIRGDGRRGEIYQQLRSLRDRYADEVRRRYPNIPRRISGYNLDELLPERGFHVARALVGSESTCALILSAKLRLMSSPPHRALLVIGFPDVATAADAVPVVREQRPIALEAFHVHVIENMNRKGKVLSGARLLPDGQAWLLVECGGESPREAEERARQAMAALERSDVHQQGMRVLTDWDEQKEVWEIREAGVGSSRVPGIEDAWPSWEDSAVAPERLGDYLRDLQGLLARFGYAYTMFGHFGQGCVHLRITFDPKTPEGVRNYRRFMEQAADLVVSYGGSLPGEHGDGQARGELLPKMFGSEIIQAFREFKAIWDPGGLMNPGKVVDALPLDQNLRTGPDYHPRRVVTHFRFPDDHGSFAEATERCFGVGKCRGLGGGTMCPSFMVTREEQYTTRGRAHLLFEMMRGDAIRDGWQDEHVKDALDLCLACKGCKGDCPVSVDIATYKAEFLSHYYESHPRPPSAYAFGLVGYLARLASAAPSAVNLVTQTPILRDVAKAAIGMAPERHIPTFASTSFQRWMRRHGASTTGTKEVILWPDTFNNFFHPHIARAATEVLEQAGFRVRVPQGFVCCGRPLFDYGFLDLAERRLRATLNLLRADIHAGVPVVGLEPSCVAVFRDELHGMLPHDADAERLGKQTFLLGDFLEKHAPDFDIPRLTGKALLHVHCHQKAVIGMQGEQAVLERTGLDFQTLDAGCCGLAGSFGFEAGEHFDVSMKAGERVLLPAVRAAPDSTLIIADGFSCREQIAQGAGRRALHLAEVLQLGLQQGGAGERRDGRQQVHAWRPSRDGA